MEIRTVQYLSDEEEEFASLLSRSGLNMTSAKVIVFLVRKTRASSREIEQGTDLRQAEVSTAVRRLTERGWIAKEPEKKSEPGRKVQILRLAIPLKKIIASLEKEKKAAVQQSLDRIKRLREFS